MKTFLESKGDQERFINKFGKDAYDVFLRRKENIKRKYGPKYIDMTWLAKHLSNADMFNMLNMTVTKAEQGEKELAQICADPRSDDAPLIYNKNGYEIYKINNVYASIKYGLAIGSRATWCTAGGYHHNGDGSLLTQAKTHYNHYLNTYTGYYFCFCPNGRKYCICPRRDGLSSDIWSGATDKTVSCIPGLLDTITDPANGNIIYDCRLTLTNEEFQEMVEKEIATNYPDISNITNFKIHDGTFEFDCQEERWRGDIEDAHYQFKTEEQADEELMEYCEDSYIPDWLYGTGRIPPAFEGDIKKGFWDAKATELIEAEVDIYSDDDIIEEARDNYDYNDYEHSRYGEPLEIPEDATGDDFTYEEINEIREWLKFIQSISDGEGYRYILDNFGMEVAMNAIPDDIRKAFDIDTIIDDLVDEEGYSLLSEDGGVKEIDIGGVTYIGWRVDY